MTDRNSVLISREEAAQLALQAGLGRSGGKLVDAIRALPPAELTDPWGKPLAPQTAKFLRGELGTHGPKE